MFLGRKSRDRMIGLVGAYAVLIAGVVYTGSIDSAPAVAAPTEAATDQRKAERADACSLQHRSDIVC